MRSPPEAPVKAVIVHDDRTKRNVNVDRGDRNRQREAKPYKLGLELIWIKISSRSGSEAIYQIGYEMF